MKTDYIKQANDFLKKTGSKLEVEFLRSGKHFSTDKENRDIYKCTLLRGTRSYTFEFGQSLVNSGFYYTIGRQKINIDRKYLQPEYYKNLIHHIRKESGYDFMNNGKSDIIHYPVTPDSYDILSCLQKWEVGTFDNFCNEFGYYNDSIQAEKVYKAVLSEYTALCTLYTDAELELMSEIN